MNERTKRVILWLLAIIILILIAICANYYLNDAFLNIIGGEI